MRNLTILSATLLALGALVLISCGPTPTAAPTAAPIAAPTATRVPPTATAVPVVKLKAAYSAANPDWVALWVAQEAGYFKKNGLDVEITFISGGGNVAKALLSGDVPIAALAPSSVVEATAAGADLVVIAGLVNRMNYDLVVQPGITKGEDFKGKKGAVSSATGSAATSLRYALREIYKVDPDNKENGIALLTIGSEPDRVTALATKQIDFTVSNPDITPEYVKNGAVVLARLWEKDIAYQHSSVATSRKFIKEKPDVVKAFVKSLVEAIAFVKDAKNKEAVIKAMAKYLKTEDQAYLNSAYDRMTKVVMQAAPYVTVEGMKTIVGECKQCVEKGLKVDDVVDNSFVKELDDSGYIKGLYK